MLIGYHSHIHFNPSSQMPGGSADISRYFPEVFDPSGQGYDLPDRSPRKRIDFKSAFKTCLMCNSYWWDYNGDICKYSDATLGTSNSHTAGECAAHMS